MLSLLHFLGIAFGTKEIHRPNIFEKKTEGGQLDFKLICNSERQSCHSA